MSTKPKAAPINLSRETVIRIAQHLVDDVNKRGEYARLIYGTEKVELARHLALLAEEHRKALEALRTLRTNVKTAAEMAHQRPEATEPGSFAGMIRNAGLVWPGMAMAAAVLDRPEAS